MEQQPITVGCGIAADGNFYTAWSDGSFTRMVWVEGGVQEVTVYEQPADFKFVAVEGYELCHN